MRIYKTEFEDEKIYFIKVNEIQGLAIWSNCKAFKRGSVIENIEEFEPQETDFTVGDFSYCKTFLFQHYLKTLDICKQEMLSFSLFCEKYPLKNKNINGDTLHAKSKYDDVFTTEELLTLYLEQNGTEV